jgi:hypothetical protein
MPVTNDDLYQYSTQMTAIRFSATVSALLADLTVSLAMQIYCISVFFVPRRGELFCSVDFDIYCIIFAAQFSEKYYSSEILSKSSPPLQYSVTRKYHFSS